MLIDIFWCLAVGLSIAATTLYLKRFAVISFVYGWCFLKEMDGILLRNVYLEYDYYCPQQKCHFYSFFLGTEDKWYKQYFGYFASIERIEGVNKGTGAIVGDIPVHFLKLDFTGVTHVRSMEEGWSDGDGE
ncbi:TMhelix containing protein [Vibrio phage 1.244.A._10N.261.54.C3]|nr:TMhelix containing protein [Vibrio phage 1.244.A._10N.261.54.C3]AUR98704.1 TMhelix containing protein [Vibrio phage 1.255.O._10N.286.45.F1]